MWKHITARCCIFPPRIITFHKTCLINSLLSYDNHTMMMMHICMPQALSHFMCTFPAVQRNWRDFSSMARKRFLQLQENHESPQGTLWIGIQLCSFVYCLIHFWKEHRDLVFFVDYLFDPIMLVGCKFFSKAVNLIILQVTHGFGTNYWLMNCVFLEFITIATKFVWFSLDFIWFSYWNTFQEILSTFRIVLEWRASWELTLMKPFVLFLLVMIASEHAHWNTSKMHKYPHLMPTGLHKQ